MISSADTGKAGRVRHLRRHDGILDVVNLPGEQCKRMRPTVASGFRVAQLAFVVVHQFRRAVDPAHDIRQFQQLGTLPPLSWSNTVHFGGVGNDMLIRNLRPEISGIKFFAPLSLTCQVPPPPFPIAQVIHTPSAHPSHHTISAAITTCTHHARQLKKERQVAVICFFIDYLHPPGQQRLRNMQVSRKKKRARRGSGLMNSGDNDPLLLSANRQTLNGGTKSKVFLLI